MLVPLDQARQQMIVQHLLFKWPTYGWYLGKISAWNSNPKYKVCKLIVKFTVFYHDDSSSRPHRLWLDNYNTDVDAWLLLEPSNPSPPSSRQLQRNLYCTNSSLVPIDTVTASRHLLLTAAFSLVENSQRSLKSWCPSPRSQTNRGVKNPQFPDQQNPNGSAMLQGQQANCQGEFFGFCLL